MTRETYTATATREGGWWFLVVDGVKGAYTQARRLDLAEAMVRDVLAMVLGVPEDSFDVTIEPDLGAVAEVVAEARRDRAALEVAQERARRATDDALAALQGAGLAVRDIGALLGLSHQRVAKMLAAASQAPPADGPLIVLDGGNEGPRNREDSRRRPSSRRGAAAR